jgi:hypothetical protein
MAANPGSQTRSFQAGDLPLERLEERPAIFVAGGRAGLGLKLHEHVDALDTIA